MGLRDFAPFVSPYSETENMSESDKSVLTENLETARQLIKLNKPEEAINILLDQLENDNMNAETNFLLGKSYYLLDKIDISRSYFIKAKDLSPLYAPYQRAPSSVNKLIRKISMEHNVALADIEQAMFQLNNGSFIPGDDFFADNLHPNTTGYAFIAEAIFQKIKQERLIERKAE